MSAATMVQPAPVRPGSDGPQQIVLLAALLARLGASAPRAAALVGGTAGFGTAGFGTGGRTCIEAGAPLVLSAGTTDHRVLGVHRRVPAPFGGLGDEQLHWQETRCSANGFASYARTVLTPGTPPSQRHLDALLAGAGASARADFRRWHALLGPYGRLYSLRQPATAESDPLWVGWQLDRGRAATALSQGAELAAGWDAAAEALAGLFPGPGGRPASALAATGPWSVAVALGQPGRLRIGTSRWAHQPDDSHKRERLGRLEERFGVPGFPLALLRLLTDRAAPRQRVARAVEVEVHHGAVSHLEFFFAVPASSDQPEQHEPQQHEHQQAHDHNQHDQHPHHPREDGPS